MPKYTISYYGILSDHIFATPEYVSSEIVNAPSYDDVVKYVLGKKDLYGHPFKQKSSFGFDFISHAGAAKIEKYNPKIKKI
jgi:hypothetical protein